MIIVLKVCIPKHEAYTLYSDYTRHPFSRKNLRGDRAHNEGMKERRRAHRLP